ncbi:hypothetical protein R3P38DRAFT_3475353 [Favolaschia claudopus]|uniref:Uncharacterized protein n=1 Tax=Favolaschia claudopus TaxID=2862362 RepID=A0AAW0CL68_9AGAR
MIFGTCCLRAATAFVPLEEGANIAMSTDDLDIDAWEIYPDSVHSAIIPPPAAIAIQSNSNGTTTTYFALAASQGVGSVGPDGLRSNGLVAAMLRTSQPSWFGNVLVVKSICHGPGLTEIVDLYMDEEAFVYKGEVGIAMNIREMYPRFWLVADLVFRVLSFLDIRAAIIFGQTCQLMRVNVQAAVCGRVLALTSPFFHGDLDKVRRVFGVMRLTNSVVSGSIATLVMDWSVPSGGLRGLMISNLNIVAPLGAHKFVCDYLSAILRDATRRDRDPSEEYRAVASKYSVFTLLRKTHLSITVTESRTTSTMPVILSGGYMTTRSEALLGWPFASTGVALARWDKPLIPPPLYGLVRTEDSNSGWQKTCGYGCPGRKRQIRGFNAVGEFAWGGIRGELDTPGGREWTKNLERDVDFRWRVALELDRLKGPSDCTGYFGPFTTSSLVVFDESVRVPTNALFEALRRQYGVFSSKRSDTVVSQVVFEQYDIAEPVPAPELVDVNDGDSNVGVGGRTLTWSNNYQFCSHIQSIRCRSQPGSKLESGCRVSGRIWWVTRTQRAALGREFTSRYDTAIAIILESGAIYCFGIILQVIALSVQDSFPTAVYLTHGAIGQVINIVPTLIIVRVGMGHSIPTTVPSESILTGQSGTTTSSRTQGISLSDGHQQQRTRRPLTFAPIAASAFRSNSRHSGASEFTTEGDADIRLEEITSERGSSPSRYALRCCSETGTLELDDEKSTNPKLDETANHRSQRPSFHAGTPSLLHSPDGSSD